MKKIIRPHTVVFTAVLVMMSCSDTDIIPDNNNSRLTRSAANNIVYFKDQFVSMNKVVTGGTIQVSDVTVTNKSKLTLSAQDAVVIDKNFSIISGAQLEITVK